MKGNPGGRVEWYKVGVGRARQLLVVCRSNTFCYNTSMSGQSY